MSEPANAIVYLYDDAAVDVSRITGLPWSYEQLETGGNRRPCLNLLELDWWDRMRVTFTVIAVEFTLACYFNPTLQVSHGASVLDSAVAGPVGH